MSDRELTVLPDPWSKRLRYSIELIDAFIISASTKCHRTDSGQHLRAQHLSSCPGCRQWSLLHKALAKKQLNLYSYTSISGTSPAFSWTPNAGNRSPASSKPHSSAIRLRARLLWPKPAPVTMSCGKRLKPCSHRTSVPAASSNHQPWKWRRGSAEVSEPQGKESCVLKAAPKGLRPPAQGCRFGLPWVVARFRFQPQRGCA